MKETKRRLEWFSIYDRTGMEKHLARMAEKGWLLDKIDSGGWRYRRTEPKKLIFSVCYFPKASAFDPGPSEEQETFYDFCQHTGWTLAAASAQLQVFYNERENPVPIDTDPVTEVDAIHRSVKRGALPSQLALLAICTLNAAMLVGRLVGDPIGVLSSPANLVVGICWVILFLLVAVEWGSYFLWHLKAVLAAEHGEFLDTHSHRSFQIGCLVVLAVVTVYFLAATFTSGNRLLMAVMALVLFLYVPAAFLLVFGIKGFMKRMKASAKTNLAVTLVGSIVLSLVIVGMITFGTLRAYNSGWFSRGGETYEYNGTTFTAYQDELPLMLEDLLDGSFDHYSRERHGEGSFLLAQYEMFQRPRYDAEGYRGLPDLEYTITVVKAPFLYGLCKDTLLHRYDYWNDDLPEELWHSYQPADPAPWDALEAYRWTTEFGPANWFLLCYESRIVEITFDSDWEITPAQMAVVAEKLGS
ncbi:MAG: DUF2812 domain-containing protein [Clostridiales bacterium]|nr:DUF2812 domain-containing protein [Clostridiales bacterium]